MIVRKLRLKKGWSQEQLAQISGLNVRTIQRIERGHSASLESKKSLAAVFEVQLSTFETPSPEVVDQVINRYENEAIEMTQLTKELENTATLKNDDVNEQNQASEDLKADERYSINYAKGLREFYQHLGIFLFVNSIIIFNYSQAEEYFPWGISGWTLGLIIHGLNAYEVVNFFDAKWERKIAEKKLGRKL